jgi:hypothetical protein
MDLNLLLLDTYRGRDLGLATYIDYPWREQSG